MKPRKLIITDLPHPQPAQPSLLCLTFDEHGFPEEAHIIAAASVDALIHSFLNPEPEMP